MRRFILVLVLVVMLSGTLIAAAQGGTTYYVVAPGDTLARIAGRFNVNVYNLASTNGIYNLNLIYVGQTLIIPSGNVTPPPPTPVPPPAQAYYTVRHGDSLGGIARLYGISLHSLQLANGIANPNLIYPGMVLTIPAGQPVPPPQLVITPYYVRYGDTLARIAGRFGSTVNAISAQNNLHNPNRIYVGQLLYIPHY